MRWIWNSKIGISNVVLLALLISPSANCATVKDIFNLNSQALVRIPRDNKYYQNRYGSSSSNDPPLRTAKPEDTSENRESATVEKRCIRCESGYLDRNPYDSRSRYDDRRNSYGSDYDRYDDRDRYYDRYDRDRYDRDRYYDRDNYDRYDRDRYYDPYDRDRNYDRYDRGRYDRDRYDRDRYDRYSDRGVGYDNRGYDYRDRHNRDGYRPLDETYRGTSGFDSNGRGYYYASGGRPDYGSGYYGGGYASGWNYGGRDDYQDRGYGSTNYRPYDGYRGTSYLYGRASTTTTKIPSASDDDGITQSPQHNSSSN